MAPVSHLIQDFWCCHIKELSNALSLCQLTPSSPGCSCQLGCENFSTHSSSTAACICASKEFLIFQPPVLLPNKYMHCVKRKKKCWEKRQHFTSQMNPRQQRSGKKLKELKKKSFYLLSDPFSMSGIHLVQCGMSSQLEIRPSTWEDGNMD